MKKVECVHCGDTVVIAERGESVVNGETPVEHMERTGHTHKAEPEPRVCNDCGNLWWYQGTAERPTCTNCRSKRTEVANELPP